MNYDQVYRKVLERLTGTIDGDKFERCAQDLLGDAYSNLAPIVGGGDDGMDGAFGTAEGPYPLICTVKKNVLGNFRDNVTTYLAKRAGPLRAVIATTQHLTPTKKRNLHKEAAKLGVTIVNIHDQAYFANRLYRQSKWRMELLGVVGDPPALSVLPPSGRFIAPEIVVGRGADLEWLRSTTGDLLLAGNSGTGKTYLHQHLAAKGYCLFAVEDDASRLADAIREQRPSVIVVDDAHINVGKLMTLRRLREELGESFAIHANCWPGYETTVRRSMEIPSDHTRLLEPLTRDTIVELIENCGVHGPETLLHLLLDQADGKPGLAVALVEACKRGGIDKVWSGEELAVVLLGNQQIVRDDSDRAVLAAFAIGGDAGIPMRAVSEALSMRQVDVRQIVTSLGAGGVVEEINELLQVRPSVLRGVLVRDVFFCGSRSIDANRLLELGAAAPTAHVLLDAYQRGATVPLDLLCSLILRANRRDVWEHFAFADERCARLIIEQYPSHAIDAAPGLLHFVPDRVLPILLNSGIASEQHATANEDDRRRRVHEWLVPEPILPGEAAKRRRLLHAALANGMRTGQCPPDMCAWALAEILCTHYHLTRTKAGSGMTMVMTRGILPTPDIAEICALWPSILELFSILPRRSQKVVLSQIEDWCFPGRFIFGFEAEPEAYSLLESNSQRMLMDVLALPTCGNACRLWAARISRWAKFQTPFAEPVGLLPTLFADRDHTRDWRQEMEDRDAELRALAARLREQPVGEAAGELASVEREADEFGGLGGYDRQNLYFRVAQLTADPTLWLSQLVDHRMKPEFIGSFVCALSPITFPEYESTLLRLLSDDLYAQIVARIALQLPNPSEAILDSAASRLQPPPRRQDGFHTGMEVSVPAMRRLLRHPNPQIRSDVVIYEWVKTKGQIRPEIAELWRVALVDVDGDEYQLEEIFQRNNELAFEWTSARIQHAHHDLWRHIRGIQLAAEVLDRNQRGELLRSFNGENYNDDCVDLLLQDDAELFNRWLCMHREDYFRLGPLDRVVGPRWEQRALTALDSGVSPQELTEHCTPHHWGGCGPLSQHFKAALPPYEALANHHDERLRSVGEWGLKQVRADYETARRQENIEAIRGR